jgi:hypothetical protein
MQKSAEGSLKRGNFKSGSGVFLGCVSLFQAHSFFPAKAGQVPVPQNNPISVCPFLLLLLTEGVVQKEDKEKRLRFFISY